MGLIFRKTVKLGLFNINLSKSGVSTSFGFKGFRINSKGQYRVGAGNVFWLGRWKRNQASCVNTEEVKVDWGALLWILFGVIMLALLFR